MTFGGRRLYPLLIASVLALGACGNEKTENGANPGPASSIDTRGSAATSVDSVAGRTDRSTPQADDPSQDETIVLFLGDSITAGYGLDPEQAFPALIQERADSLGISARMINAGLSGETSAGGLRRIGWLLRTRVDVLVLELGGNDGLRGIDLADTERNLLGIVDSVRASNPEVKVVVAGMMIPPNLGPDYTTRFRDLYPEVARRTGGTLIPFLLEGVGGNPDLMQRDGIHPTAEGHRIMARTVWPYIESYLGSDDGN